MKKIELLLTVGFVLLVSIGCQVQQSTDPWKSIFEKYDASGTFVLKNIGTKASWVYNKERSDIRYSPASTFKILNSMIALQTAAVTTVDDTLIWDGIKREYTAWNQNQTMRKALPISCVWFYQRLAKRIGAESMQQWINATTYGNMEMGNEVDKFWLNGKLKISTKEQVAFIEKLVNNKLAFDKDIQNTLKQLMVTDSTSSYVIHSKTGWTGKIGWNVGFVEANEEVWVFALNIDMDKVEIAQNRILITYDILKANGIIE